MTPLSKTKQQFYASLKQGKIRDREGLFIIEGRKGVSDTLGAFPLEALIGTEEALAGFDAGPKLAATPAQLERISLLTTPPDVIAVYRKPEEEEGIRWEKKLYLLLDGVRDPGNLGTILRTADWFGIYDIVCSPDCADVYNPKCIQATMGSIGRVKVRYMDLLKAIESADGFPVYGTSLRGEDIEEARFEDYGLIVMGNEGKGISDAVMERVTHPLLIRSKSARAEHSESLNVGVATGIILFIFTQGKR